MRRFAVHDASLYEVLQGASIAVILRAMGAACAFCLNVLIGRLLGVQGAGYYYLALSVVSIGAVLARLGMDQALMRFVAFDAAKEDWGRVNGVFALGGRTALLASLALSLAILAAAPWIAQGLLNDPGLTTPLRWISLGTCSFAMVMLVAESLKALSRIRESMLVSGVVYPVVALALIWPLTRLMGASGAALAYVLGTMAAALLGYVFWRRAVAPHAAAGAGFPAGELWQSANKLWLMSIINSAILPWLPLFLLGVWGTTLESGILGAATRMSMLMASFLAAANTVAAPKFAQLFAKQDMAGLRRLASRFALIIALVSSPVFAVMIFASDWLMSLFGPDFARGGIALTIITLGQAVNTLTGSVGYLLMMTGHERDIRNSAIFAALIMGGCAVALIPTYGLTGAAIASAAAVAGMSLINAALVYMRLGFVVIPR
ncbi:MAG: oligosaccharide flippase family protein [Rhodobacteraceae bacterium]|nr:oligosaccharide flippase family protein [Paracoccaceae bacterium]